jgi:hypothetical protein
VLSVKELRALALSLKLDPFRKQMGPFALVQRPPGERNPQPDPLGLPMNVAATSMARPSGIARGALSLLFEFEDLLVATLPPIEGKREAAELTVGRQPDCDLVVDDLSVSKLHAVLRWYPAARRCTVEDKGSTNGTLLNATLPVRAETTLRDGDILSFGEAQFWYLLTETLHGKLAKADESNRLGSHSG